MFDGYLLSIVGIIVLLMVVQLILPEGKIGGSVRSILGVFLIFTVVSPLVKLFHAKLDFTDLSSYELDENFLSNTRKNAQDLVEQSLENELNKQYSGVKVAVSMDDSLNQVNYIFIDLSDFVINLADEHINYYTAIKEFVKEQIDISDERIVIYG